VAVRRRRAGVAGAASEDWLSRAKNVFATWVGLRGRECHGDVAGTSGSSHRRVDELERHRARPAVDRDGVSSAQAGNIEGRERDRADDRLGNHGDHLAPEIDPEVEVASDTVVEGVAIDVEQTTRDGEAILVNQQRFGEADRNLVRQGTNPDIAEGDGDVIGRSPNPIRTNLADGNGVGDGGGVERCPRAKCDRQFTRGFCQGLTVGQESSRVGNHTDQLRPGQQGTAFKDLRWWGGGSARSPRRLSNRLAVSLQPSCPTGVEDHIGDEIPERREAHNPELQQRKSRTNEGGNSGRTSEGSCHGRQPHSGPKCIFAEFCGQMKSEWPLGAVDQPPVLVGGSPLHTD